MMACLICGIKEDLICSADEVQRASRVHPGAYRKVSLEIKVHHLAVNALLKCNQLNELEGADFSEFDNRTELGKLQYDESFVSDEATSCAPSFRVLKQLAQKCLTDAVETGDVFADAILQNLYRWICSPQSKLHDPAIHKVLFKIMQKIFMLLLAEIRKLGATVVFANFSKIVIETGKFNLPAAKAYCECLIGTLKNRELFEWIELEPLQFWHSLLFMNEYNYGGIPAKDNSSCSTVNEDETSVMDTKVYIASNWNIAEHLPKKIRDQFVLTVSEFVFIPWDHVQRLDNKRVHPNTHVSCTPSVTASNSDAIESYIVRFLKDQICTYFTDKIMAVVRGILPQKKGEEKTDHEEKAVPFGVHGGDQKRRDSSLEFINHVSATLILDQSVEHEVLLLQRLPRPRPMPGHSVAEPGVAVHGTTVRPAL